MTSSDENGHSTLGYLMHSEESSSIRTDVEKVLESKLLRLREEKELDTKVYSETKVQKEIIEQKYDRLCERVDGLLEIIRLNKLHDVHDISTSLLSEADLASLFRTLENILLDLFSKVSSKSSADLAAATVNKLKSEHEDEKQRLKQQIQSLCKEQATTKEELESNKAHAFSLLQKLSCARSELITSEENHRKQVSILALNSEKERQYSKTEFFRLQSEKDKALTNLMISNKELALCRANLEGAEKEISRIDESLKLLQIENEKLKRKETSNRQTEPSLKDYENCDSVQADQKQQSDQMLKHLEKECGRLRKHLVEMEERYTREAVEAEEQKAVLSAEVDRLKTKLSSATVSAQSVKSDSCKQLEDLTTQLLGLTRERDDLAKKFKDSEKLVASYSSSIENLHAVLEQYEKNHQLQQMVELERCKHDLKVETTKCHQLIQQVAMNESEIGKLKTQLSEMKNYEEQLKLSLTHIGYLQHLVHEKDENLNRQTEEMRKAKGDDDAKIDKLIMKNLLIGYLHAPTSKKLEALSIVGRFLDFSKDELDLMSRSGGWTDYLRQQYSPIDHPCRDTKPPQSFSELFIKFLERESRPVAPILKMTDTESQTFHQRRSLECHQLHGQHHEPMQEFLMSLKQQHENVSSPTLSSSISPPAPVFTPGHAGLTDIAEPPVVSDVRIDPGRQMTPSGFVVNESTLAVAHLPVTRNIGDDRSEVSPPTNSKWLSSLPY